VPLNIKPGNWATTITVQTSGSMPYPEELLAKMTPEQRARLEAALTKQANTPPKTHELQKCLTKEDIAKAMALDTDESCKLTVVSSTSSRIEGRMSCGDKGVSMNGTMQLEASSAEAMKFTYHLTSGDGTHTMTVTANGTSKWMGPTCPEKEK
jgi:hypothetical protein